MREFIKLEIYEKAYIIISINKRGYTCLNDIYFCTVDKNKDIIKGCFWLVHKQNKIKQKKSKIEKK